jgi:hypothetical protein
LRVEPALQDEGGGELVHHASANLAADLAIGRMVPRGFERSVGFGGREAFIPEVDREAGVGGIGDVFVSLGRLGEESFQLIHKTMDSLGLPTMVSREL